MTLDPLTTSKQFFQNLFVAGTTSIFTKTLAAPFEGFDKLFEGFLAFWRGNIGRIVRSTPQQALGFAFNDIFKKIFSQEGLHPKTDFWRFFFGNLAAGGAAGSVSSLIIYPIDHARARSALELVKGPTERKFGGIRDFLKKIYVQHGIRGVYQGFSASLLASLVYRAVYFGGYGTVKSLISDQGSFIEKYLAAQGVTSVAGLVSYPLEVVRIRAMLNLFGLKDTERFKGIVDCVKKVASEEGWQGFVKESRLNLLHGVAPALNLVLYDTLQSRLFQKSVVGL